MLVVHVTHLPDLHLVRGDHLVEVHHAEDGLVEEIRDMLPVEVRVVFRPIVQVVRKGAGQYIEGFLVRFGRSWWLSRSAFAARSLFGSSESGAGSA